MYAHMQTNLGNAKLRTFLESCVCRSLGLSGAGPQRDVSRIHFNAPTNGHPFWHGLGSGVAARATQGRLGASWGRKQQLNVDIPLRDLANVCQKIDGGRGYGKGERGAA